MVMTRTKPAPMTRTKSPKESPKTPLVSVNPKWNKPVKKQVVYRAKRKLVMCEVCKENPAAFLTGDGAWDPAPLKICKECAPNYRTKGIVSYHGNNPLRME
jgi:hypothetical protein